MGNAVRTLNRGKEIRTISIKTVRPSTDHPELKVTGYNSNGDVVCAFNPYYGLNDADDPAVICGIEIIIYGGPWKITNKSGKKVRILSGLSGAPFDIEDGALIIPVDQTHNNVNLLLQR